MTENLLDPPPNEKEIINPPPSTDEDLTERPVYYPGLEKLIYVNDRGGRIEFSPRSKYHVNMKDVTGLGDIQRAIHSTPAGIHGDTVLGYRTIARDIEIVGKINERDKGRLRHFRNEMNRIMNPEIPATLIYECGNVRRFITCIAEQSKGSLRNSVSETFVIQLCCANPFWREHETRHDVALWRGAFEFPEPDGLMLHDARGWEIEYRDPSHIVNAFNSGDVRAGVRVEFWARPPGFVVNPLIINVNTREFIKLNTEMKSGDVITVNTGYGMKGATMNRAGTVTNAFRVIDIGSTYIQLEPGNNPLRYDAEDGRDNLEIYVFHNNVYSGV